MVKLLLAFVVVAVSSPIESATPVLKDIGIPNFTQEQLEKIFVYVPAAIELRNSRLGSLGYKYDNGKARYSEDEKKVFPLFQHASNIINKLISENAAEVIEYFNFSPNNSFESKELVAIFRSDKTYRYALVVGATGDGRYRVQFGVNQGKDLKPGQIGKMLDLDFNLLDSELPVQVSAHLEEQYAFPKVIAQLVVAPSNPNLRAVKQAIQYDTIAEVKKALGPNKEYLEITDGTGYTPLLFAVYLNKPEMVEFLLKEGANREAKLQTPMGEKNAIELARHLGHEAVLVKLTN